MCFKIRIYYNTEETNSSFLFLLALLGFLVGGWAEKSVE